MSDSSDVAERTLSTGKRLAFSAIMVLLLVSGIELVLRLSGAADECALVYANPSRVCDPILHFKNSSEMTINGTPVNDAGFRTHDFGAKQPGVFRVLSLGDSCTIGVIGKANGSGYVAEPYPALLERLAAERVGAGKVEVFNLGVGGYNSFQGLMLLRTTLRRLEPDLITVRFGWNDHFMSIRNPRAFQEPENRLALAVQDLLLRTKLYAFFRRVAIGVQVRANPPPEKPELPSEWIPTIPVERYRNILTRIVEIGRGLDADVWLLTAPSAFDTDEYRNRYEEYAKARRARLALAFNALQSYERFVEIHEDYNDATREVSRELDVTLIDMVAVYREHADRHLFSTVDAMHPLQAGHSLEAERLYEELARRLAVVAPVRH